MSRRLVAAAGLLLALSHGAAAQQAARWNPGQDGASLEIALVTIGPGSIYWERFGHNAIAVRDTASGRSVLYNYGMFDFGQANFLLNFVRGRMQYQLVAQDAGADLASYGLTGRRVDVQHLNLPPAQRVALRDFLAWNARPENAGYRYDYFLDNCSTRVRDALDKVLGGMLAGNTLGQSAGTTFRRETQRLTAPVPWLYLGTHAGLGPFTDTPIDRWQAAFVPMTLQEQVRNLGLSDDDGRAIPLVAKEERLLEATIADPLAEPPAWRWRFAAVGLAVAGLLLGMRALRWRRTLALAATTLWLFAGLGGVLLLGLWFGTDHASAWRNQNVLLFNPLALLLLPAAAACWKGAMAGRASRVVALIVVFLSAAAAMIKLLPLEWQDNGDWIALWLPIHVALAAALAPRKG
jgi:hypothetical protein